jgi:hypothetical protein
LADGDPASAAALAGEVIDAAPGMVDAWALGLEALDRPGMAGQRQDLLARLDAALHAGRFVGRDRIAATVLQARHTERAAAGNSNHSPELPLVGRDLILERLLRFTIDGDSHEKGRVVVLNGGAGLGKSRVLRELAMRLRHHDVETVLVTAVPSEQRNRWALLTRTVRLLVGRPGALGIDAESAETLTRLDPELARHFPAVTNSATKSPAAPQLLRAIGDLLDAVQETKPCVIMLDDLQLGDPDSLRLLALVLARPAAAGTAARMVGCTRPGQHALPSTWTRWQLTPLDIGDMTQLVTRAIPGLAAIEVVPVAEQLMLLTGGVPLYLRRALRLLVDNNTLRHDDGVYSLIGESGGLVAVIRGLSLQSDPRFPRDLTDQRLLGYLAVAEETVELAELHGALDRADAAGLVDRLERLAHEGWVHLHGEVQGASMAHVVIAEQVEGTLPPSELAALRMRRAEWLRANGSRLADTQAAVRLYLRAGENGAALATVRAWRRQGGGRSRLFAERIIPPESGLLMGWRLRLAAMRLEGPALVVALLAVVGAVSGGNWWMNQPSELRLENTPVMFPIVWDGPTSLNQQAPVFTVRNRRGEITKALDGRPLEVFDGVALDSITGLAAVVVKDGWVDGDPLRLWASDDYDSLVTRFRVAGLSTKPTLLAHGFSHQALSIISGVLNGRNITADRPSVEVRPGASIYGSVTLRYVTSSIPVLWYMAASSTFPNDPPEIFAISSLLTGATSAVLAQRVHLTAPTTPGTYWLVWAFAAENAGDDIFSRTNWMCDEPVWHDGNDLLEAGEEALIAAWGSGYIGGTRTLCQNNQPRFEDPINVPVATIRVVVRAE